MHESTIFVNLPDGTSRLIPNWEDRMADWNRITFKHCGTSERIPEKILKGEEVAIVEKPLPKVRFI